MTPGHILFIPAALMIGAFLGFILGARAARNQFDLQQKREAEREADEQLVRARDVAASAGIEDPSDADERSREEQRERLSTRRYGHDESGD